jgi:hypothetical protein
MKYKLNLLLLNLFIFTIVAHAQVKNLTNSRPNIIFVMTDDQGMGDFSCMGNEVFKTPIIDLL